MQPQTTPSAWRADAPLAARRLTTEQVAEALHVKPATIRSGLHYNGHYLGLKPVKLPNRRLLWDAAQVEAIASGEAE